MVAATKAVPKELLPVVDRPVLQYIVEEAAAAGIGDILLVTGRGKTSMVDHFDRQPYLESRLEARFGLSLSGLELLGRLAAAPGRRLRLSVLAGATGLTLSRISRIVDTFEARRLVERRTCVEDGRATNAWLTNAGLELVREAQAAHVSDVQRVFFDALSTAELETLAGTFARLAETRIEAV